MISMHTHISTLAAAGTRSSSPMSTWPLLTSSEKAGLSVSSYLGLVTALPVCLFSHALGLITFVLQTGEEPKVKNKAAR